MAGSFVRWFEGQTGVSAADIHLEPAFAIAVCRIEVASANAALDPVAAIRNNGSPLSRVATKAMLSRLNYNATQVRIIQRLLGGSSGGWPGLIRIFVEDARPMSRWERQYVLRAVRNFRAAISQSSQPNAHMTHYGLTG